jgi:hypothetical protein
MLYIPILARNYYSSEYAHYIPQSFCYQNVPGNISQIAWHHECTVAVIGRETSPFA